MRVHALTAVALAVVLAGCTQQAAQDSSSRMAYSSSADARQSPATSGRQDMQRTESLVYDNATPERP
jgi:hypothetical protein